MVEIDSDIRLYLETRIDAILSDPDMKGVFQHILIELGIEPNIDAIICFVSGNLLASVSTHYEIKKGRNKGAITNEEGGAFIKAVGELLARRIVELRQHFEQSKYL